MSKVQNFCHLPLDQITPDQFKDFLHHRIVEDNISVSMVNQGISAFKIMQEDVLGRPWDPIRIKRPRREKKLPVVLRQQEVEAMLQMTSNLKHRAMLALAYSTGLRREEVRVLRPRDIDPVSMRVHVVSGKGKKDRDTILSQKALELLRQYYKLFRPGEYLFEPLGKKGKPLAGSTLNTLAKQAAKRAGIQREISFHTLRHCFATHMLEKGVNLKLIQKFMGHASIKTTAIYLHLVHIDMGNIKSPLDQMDI